MVLQREADVQVWGWAEAGERITVRADWLDKEHAAEADENGNWHVHLRTGPAGGPHSLTVTGNNSITLDDILFGEVWIGSGQSNMEMPLTPVSGAYTGIQNHADEIAQAIDALFENRDVVQ